VDAASVRRLALHHPEAHEKPHFDMASFRVRDRIFATVPPAEDRVHVFIDPDRVEEAVGEGNGSVEPLWWGGRVRDPDHLQELLHEAWSRRAPKRLLG
jgi:hypothetical protein